MTAPSAELLTLARILFISVPENRDVFTENLTHRRDRPIRLIPTDISAFTESLYGLGLICDNDFSTPRR